MKKRLLALLLIVCFVVTIPCQVSASTTTSSKKFATPTVSASSNLPYISPTVKWSAIDGASKYQVWYRVNGGDWKVIGTTKKTSYYHQNAKANNKYEYAVRLFNDDGACSSFGYSNVYVCTAPKVIVKNHSTLGKPNLTWSSIAGASSYEVWYRVNGSNWKKIGPTQKTYFYHYNAKIGNKYEYAVRAYGDGVCSAFGSSSKITCLYQTPTVSVSTNSLGKPVVKWSSIVGASEYQLWYSENGGEWQEIDTIKSTTYTHSDASVGNIYKYAVRVFNGAGSEYGFSSDYYYYYPTPTVSVSTNSSGKPVIKWSSIVGASQYQLWYRENGGDWQEIDTIKSTTYTHSDASVGNIYKYAVRVFNGAGSEYGYSSKYYYYYPTPTVSVSTNSSGKPVVKWSSIVGASEYQLWYSENGGDWQEIGTIKSTTYTHYGASAGNKYAYAVRVYSGAGSKYGYSSEFYYCFPKPENIGVIQTPTTLTVYWDPVPGATGYYVYADRNGDGIYQYRDCTTKTSYTQERMAAYNYVDVACSFRITVADGEISNDSGYSKTINQLDPPYIPKY